MSQFRSFFHINLQYKGYLSVIEGIMAGLEVRHSPGRDEI